MYYYEARWFSRCSVFSRVFELKDEVAMILSDNNNKDEATLSYDTKFLLQFTHFVNIFEKLSTLKNQCKPFKFML